MHSENDRVVISQVILVGKQLGALLGEEPDASFVALSADGRFISSARDAFLIREAVVDRTLTNSARTAK
jgi:hypothetical protein